MNKRNQWHIGTIGFSYRDWLGPFYPIGMRQRDYLPYYSKVFNSVELDTTFHAVPRHKTIVGWANSTPDGFVFSLKTPRRITHELELHDSFSLMDEFLDSLSPLENKVGPILIQLPPRFTLEKLPILTEFLSYLPSGFQFAIEFRHHSWYNKRTGDLLSKYNVCWTAIDYPKLPKEIIITTNFLYIRWIGINNLYHYHTHERVDRTDQLKEWLDIIQKVAEQVDGIYGYFNNDYAGFAAGTGIRFKQLAGINYENHEVPTQDRFL